MPRRTLAEELAELATTGPAPDLDPEADAFGEGPTLVDSDGDEGGRVGARRLRGDIGDLGVEYAGRLTSAAAAFGAAEDGSSLLNNLATRESSASEEDDLALIGAGEPGQSDTDGAGSLMQSDESDGDSDGDRGHAAAQGGQLGGDESSGDEDDDEAAADGADVAVARMMAAAAAGGGIPPAAAGDIAAGDSDASSDDEMRQAPPDTDGELEALEREFDAVAAADAEAAGGLAEKAEADRRRGMAAGRQRRLWERALELRIRAQRAVAASQRLPGPEAHTVAAAASPELAGDFAAAAAAAAAAIQELLALQGALVAQNPAVAEAAEAAEAAAGGAGVAGSRKREGDQSGAAGLSEAVAALWQQIEDGTAAWAPYRDASLDRWQCRAALSGGAAAARGGLKALAQPLSAQVAAALATPGRMSVRSQLPRAGAQPVLCELQQPDADAAAGSAADAAAHGVMDAAADGGAGASQLEQRLPHTYDDGDLYEQLLKEFLEGSGAPGGGGVLLQRAPKRRKTVDRRASKGRKLRYHVHEKLVNFMTPATECRSSADGEAGVSAALCSNLFGQRQLPAPAAQLA